MRKIIFLDIDGVMITDFKPIDHWYANPECIKNLKILVDAGAEIVITSKWKRFLLEETKADLSGIGIPSLWIKDQTIDGYHHPKGLTVARGSEIRHWVRQYLTPEDRWVIIDDESDILFNQAEHFFPTQSNTGLTKEITDQIMEYFQTGLRRN